MTQSEPSVPEPTPYQMDLPTVPYPGLRPFKSSEAAIFYGRNAQKDAVLERLNESRMVFVTGPSGCGKSSLIKAGVIPALRAGLLDKVGYRWKTTEMRPGRRPLINLIRALEDALGRNSSGGRPGGSELRSYLENDEAGLWAAMTMMGDKAENPRAGDSRPLLLLIDQFEEIFGQQIKDSSEVDKFVRLLVTQYARPHPSLFVVFTIRSDYVGLCASFPGLSDAINHCQYLTPILTAAELSDAIVRPAEDYGAHVSGDLVNEILADMHSGAAYDADNLPLMEHALLWLWQKAKESGSHGTSGPDATPAATLDADEYRKAGRLRGILGQHADAILSVAAGQNGERGAIAEALFRRLAERDSKGRYRRSPASFEEVKEIASCSEAELKRVIAPFEEGKASFLEIRKSLSADENLLDISHEALIRTWDKARAWTDLEAEKVRTFRGLLRSAEAWRDDHENPDLLKHRPDLDLFERWWSRSAPTVSWAKRYFDQNGQGTKAAAAIGLLTRYRAMSIEADKREKRRWATLKFIAIGSVVAAVFVVFGSYSWMTLRDAKKDAARAHADATRATAELLQQRVKTIALRAEDALDYEGPVKALLFAMEAQNQGLPDLLETERVIFKSLMKPMEKRIISEVSMTPMGVAYSWDGKAIVSMDSNFLHFWNPSGGTPIDTYPVDALKIAVSSGRIQWSPAGDWLAISSLDQTVLLAPCSRPKLKALFPGCAQEDKDRQQLIGDSKHQAGLAKFSKDGRWMVTGGFGATLKRWEVANGDAAAGKEISAAMTIAFPNAFAISPDMKKVAAGLQFGKIGIFDPDSGELQAMLLPPREDQKEHGSVITLSFNPSNPNMVVASEQGGSIFVWDVENNEAKRLTGTQGTAYQVAFSSDGKFIAAASDDGVIRTWKTQELTNEPNKLAGHSGPVYWVAYGPDGSLASACPTDKTIRIWNQRSPLGEAPRPLVSRSIGARSSEGLPRDFGPVVASAESETGRRVVAWKEGRFALYNVAEGWPEPIFEWQGPTDVTSLMLEHDPDRIVAVSSSGLRATWPFFRDVSALISFARNQIPFNGDGQQTLTKKDRCKIAPPDDSTCKPNLEPIP